MPAMSFGVDAAMRCQFCFACGRSVCLYHPWAWSRHAGATDYHWRGGYGMTNMAKCTVPAYVRI